jgi:hypothetical protein
MKTVSLSPESVVQVLRNLLLSMPADQNLSISQISKDSGIDFYKYQKGGSVPSIKSMVTGFNSMDCCPEWAFLVACRVVKGTLTFDQARAILSDWHLYKGYAEGRMEEIIKRMVEMSSSS